MKYKIFVYLDKFKKEINREIIVSGKLNLKYFCESIIVSMNGNGKHLYQLVVNEEYSLLGPGNNPNPLYEERLMEDDVVDDLCLEVDDELLLNYDYYYDWDFHIFITAVYEDDSDKLFEVISGRGNGIIEDLGKFYNLRDFLNCKNEKMNNIRCNNIKGYKDYISYVFDVDDTNLKIANYFEKIRKINKPKHYIMNISLDGFNKNIKRKISVDSNYSIELFCRKVIICMNGDLNHMYGIKIGKEFLDMENKESDLSCLELKEKQKFKIIYDFGDNWIFNVTVSKIVENYGMKKFYLIDGKGKGIVEDCGGIIGLSNIYTSDYGICDVDKINMLIDNVL